MKKHDLKVRPEHFVALIEPELTKRNNIDLRRDDRGYEVGDVLVLHEWDPQTELYTGRYAVRVISHIVRGEPGLQEGYVALAFCDIDDLIYQDTDKWLDLLDSLGIRYDGWTSLQPF